MDRVMPTFSPRSDQDTSYKRPRQLTAQPTIPQPTPSTLPIPSSLHMSYSSSQMSPNRVTISSLLSIRPTIPSSNSQQLPTLPHVLQVPDRSTLPTSTGTTDLPHSDIVPTSAVSTPSPSAITPPMRYSSSTKVAAPLPVHSRGVSTKRKVIPCPYEFCNKKFSRNSNLKVHMRIHTKTYPFACNLCEREFMWSSSLHWHTKWHEKVAQREADKLRSANGMAPVYSGKDSCTCNCVCPVHKISKMALQQNMRDKNKITYQQTTE